MKRFLTPISILALALVLMTQESSIPEATEEEGETPVPRSTSSQNEEASSPPSENREPQSLRSKIASLEECLKITTCDFPQTDPRSYEIAVTQELLKQVSQYRLESKDDPSQHDELMRLGISLIHSHDGYLQAEALNLFASLPPSAESLEAITEGLHNAPDPLVMEQSLAELKRYLGSDLEPKVHRFLTEAISSGAHFSSQAVAKNILPFITEKSLITYTQTLEKMPKDSRAASTLDWALREYRRLSSGA